MGVCNRILLLAETVNQFLCREDSVRKLCPGLLQLVGKFRYLRDVQAKLPQLLHLGKDFHRCSFHDKLTGIHNKNAVRCSHLFHVMSNKDNCDMLCLVKIPDRLYDFFSSVRIQHGSRLVQNNAFRLHGHDAGNRDPLLLSAGKFIRRMLPVGDHSCFSQAVVHTFPDFIGRNTQIFRSETHIFLHHGGNYLVIRILKDHAGFLADFPERIIISGIHVVNVNGSLRRNQERIDMFGQCRLAASVMTENGNKLSALHFQVYVTNRMYDLRLFAFVLVILHIIVAQLFRMYDRHTFSLYCIISLSIQFQTSSRPSLLVAENGKITLPGFMSSPVRISRTCFWIWLRFSLSAFVAITIG